MTKQEYREYLCKEVYKTENIVGVKKYFFKIFNKYFSPSTNAGYLVRKMQYLHSKGKIGRLRSAIIQQKLVKRYSMHIGAKAVFGIGLKFPHPLSIVIGSSVICGNNCSIYQGVTLGGAHIGDVLKGNQPKIGNDVIIFEKSSVLGKVQVADGVTIGAHALLLKDATESCGIYVGQPAKQVKNKELSKVGDC